MSNCIQWSLFTHKLAELGMCQYEGWNHSRCIFEALLNSSIVWIFWLEYQADLVCIPPINSFEIRASWHDAYNVRHRILSQQDYRQKAIGCRDKYFQNHLSTSEYVCNFCSWNLDSSISGPDSLFKFPYPFLFIKGASRSRIDPKADLILAGKSVQEMRAYPVVLWCT